MSKFFKSIWSDLLGGALAIGSTLTIPDLIHSVSSGKILTMLGTLIGGALIGAGRGTEERK